MRQRLPSEKQIRWFEDILENIDRIKRFTAGKDFQAFLADEQSTYAVLHALLIISEAARRLGKDAEDLAPTQPWRSIRALGNMLRHEYGGIDPGAIWHILTDDLLPLQRAIQSTLDDRGSGEEP